MTRIDWMPEEVDDDGEEFTGYRLSPSGFRQIVSWMRFQNQLCEMEHSEQGIACDDDTHQVAFMMCFVVFPMMEMMDISWTDDSGDLNASWLEETDGDTE